MAIKRTGTVTEHGEMCELTLERAVMAKPTAVWPFLSESDSLGRWFGNYVGEPESGEVVLAMTAEDGEATSAVEILECLPAEHLIVQTTDESGSWSLEIELVADESDAGTLIRFSHHELPLSMLPDVGAGWEWYLDRLVAALAGEPMPAWDDYYPVLRDAYAG